MNRQKKYIKTAQFAKLCNVSKQTLIYYDKIGVFHPDFVDEKGYRYYSQLQYYSFHIITMLCRLGTPLKEIKKYVDRRDPSCFIDLLNKKQDEIKKQMKNLVELSNLIDNRRNMTIEGVNKIGNVDVNIVDIPVEYLLLSKQISVQNEIIYINAIRDLEIYSEKNDKKTFSDGAMVLNKSLLKKNYDNLSHFYVKIDTFCENAQVKSAGKYAIAYHYGDFSSINITYNRISKYIDDNNYQISGNSYEKILLDYCTQKNKLEYLTKISIKVTRKNLL